MEEEQEYESDESYDESEEMEDGSDTEVSSEWYEGLEEEEDKEDSEAEDEEEMEEDEQIWTLSEPDLLDCPICTEPLSFPVYQCDSGHVVCSSCCSKIHSKCPSCSLEIGHSRCLFVEKLLESLTAPCRNKKYGCGETLKHYNKHEHEKKCLRSPCSCPVTGCNFEGSMAGLYSHFCCSHIFATPIFSYNEYNLIELEKSHRHLIFCGEDNSIFVLNKFSEVKGSAINVVRIAPLGSDTLAYDIKARYEQTSVILQSSLENTPKWKGCRPERNYLFVPDYCTTSEGQLRLELCIRTTQQSQVPELFGELNIQK